MMFFDSFKVSVACEENIRSAVSVNISKDLSGYIDYTESGENYNYS